MSIDKVYMDDGETETEDFRTLRQCLESEIEHYPDITKAKLVNIWSFHFAPPFLVYAICELYSFASVLLSTLQLVFTNLFLPFFLRWWGHEDIHACMFWEALFCLLYQPHWQSHWYLGLDCLLLGGHFSWSSSLTHLWQAAHHKHCIIQGYQEQIPSIWEQEQSVHWCAITSWPQRLHVFPLEIHGILGWSMFKHRHQSSELFFCPLLFYTHNFVFSLSMCDFQSIFIFFHMLFFSYCSSRG